ncbi:MAG: helix-turn-helix domain-containing protein [Anaerolineales bacterium]
MPATQATSIAQRCEMMRLEEEGHTYATVAKRMGISFWTVRKWIRQGKRSGTEKLASCYGRPPTGPLAGFDPIVRYVCLRLKRQYPKWGAVYVVKKMGERASLRGKKLPSSTTIWRYWSSFGDRIFLKREPSRSKVSPSDKPHGVWQRDAKESMQIPGVGIVSFNQARDEFGRVTVLHRVHAEPERARKLARLTGEMVFQDCRIAFSQWGMPEAIQTDRDTIYVDSGQSPFPNRIVLWWVGLGIEQRLIPRRTPKRNGTVERSHRTLLERTLEHQAFENAAELQKQVDADWHELNHACPSKARGCQGKPPLEAHPELLRSHRPYRPEWELELFDLKRVDHYLAEFTWTRTCTSVGQLRMRKVRYSLGYAWAHQNVSVTYDPEPRQFVFTQIRSETRKGKSQPKLDPVRRKAKNLSVEDITGLAGVPEDLPTRQLMFPLFICYPKSEMVIQGA